MKKFFLKVISFFMLFMMPFYGIWGIQAGEDRQVTLNVRENSAYVLFSDPPVQKNLTFEDGYTQGITDPINPLYSEVFIQDGIQARKVYKENYLYFTLDKSFYDEGDHEFLVRITYYDFGPNIGYFHLDYNSSDQTLNEESRLAKRISIMKKGIPKWCEEKIYINDAQWSGGLEHGADFMLVSNAYNAFAKVEILNLSGAKKDQEMELPTVNEKKEESLKALGLYGELYGEPVPSAESKMTREEAVVSLIKALGWEETALNTEAADAFSDVPDRAKPYFNYAAAVGIVKGTGDGKAQAKDIATKRDLLTFYLRALGYSDATIVQNFNELVYETLIEDADLIFHYDTPLTRDNFVAIAFNALIHPNQSTGRLPLSVLISEGKITKEMIEATGESVLISQMMREPLPLEAKEIIDPITGRTIHYMNINGEKAIRPYVTQQHWTSDGKRFVIGSDSSNTLYEYNVEEQTIKMLDTARVSGAADAVITPDDKMFYRTPKLEIYKMDLHTYEKEKIADTPPEATGLDTIQVTNDGKYMSAYWLQESQPEDYYMGINRLRIIPRLDCETGIWDTSISHEFNDEQFPSVGHPIINPEYPNLVFFCHEGTTTAIHDRLWIADFNTGQTRNLFIQATRPDGKTGETSGHEVWSADGEDLFFIKYTFDQNLGQSGIVRISKDGSQREYINGDYPYWHCYPSTDKKWVAADTQISGNKVEIVLVNTETYESYYLAKFDLPYASHPYQAHPIISPDGTKVSFQMFYDGQLGCAWMDISDIVGKNVEGGRFQFSKNLDYVSYDETSSSVNMTEYLGETAYYIPKGNSLFLDIDDKMEQTDTVKLRITYLDIGKMPLDILYTGKSKTPADYAYRENQVVSIERNDTQSWKTVEIEIRDANFNNAGQRRTDLRVEGRYSLAYIKDIEIIA